jgi:hypothetical protein
VFCLISVDLTHRRIAGRLGIHNKADTIRVGLRARNGELVA